MSNKYEEKESPYLQGGEYEFFPFGNNEEGATNNPFNMFIVGRRKVMEGGKVMIELVAGVLWQVDSVSSFEGLNRRCRYRRYAHHQQQ